MKVLQERFNATTAYNYHRFSPEIEDCEWELFFRDLVDNLFETYDHILVTENDEILGVNKRGNVLLKKHSGAYQRVEEVTDKMD